MEETFRLTEPNTDIALALAFSFELLAVSIAIAKCVGTKGEADTLGIIAVLASLFGFFGCLFTICWTYSYLEAPEKKVENELSVALSRSYGQRED